MESPCKQTWTKISCVYFRQLWLVQSSQCLKMKLKTKLVPYLRKQGLEWSDVLPVLEAIDTVEELQAAVADPGGNLAKLAKTSIPLAKKLAIMKLKPKMEARLLKQGLEWSDVLPVLEQVDTVEELQAAVTDPQAFLKHLASAGGGGRTKWRHRRWVLWRQLWRRCRP